MKHVLPILIASLCSPTFAQIQVKIDVPTEIEVGQPIVATVSIEGLPENAEIKGPLIPRIAGASWLPGPTKEVFYIWGKASKEPYEIELLGMWGVRHAEIEGTWIDFGFFRDDGDAKFTIKGPLPPTPDPPTGNQPDLTRYFRDWATTVINDTTGLIKDTDQWRTAFESASALLIGGTDYVAVEGRTEQIEFILAETIGVSNQTFTEGLRVKLSDALEQIALSVIVGGTEAVIRDANYRPLIAILTGLAITPSAVAGSAVYDSEPPHNPAAVGIQWVSHAEAMKRSKEGAFVVVQLSMTGCAPCRHLERDVFPSMKQPKDFVFMRLKDQGSAWGVHSFPASVLVGPGWRIKQRVTTPSSVAGVEEMLKVFRGVK